MSNLLVIPIATEKAYSLVAKDTYMFKVPLNATKPMIKVAIEKQYGVSVVSIRTSLQSGKAVRYMASRRAQPKTTNRSDVKKAYVTLKKGDSIKVFEESNEKNEEKK